MPASVPTAVPVHSYSWRRFFLLTGAFFVAVCLGGLVPTPGSWSDVRSQWLGAAVVAVACVAFLLVTASSYWSRSTLTGLQATLLALLFGTVLVLMMRELYASVVFLRQVSGSHRAVETGAPNLPLHWIGSSRFSLVSHATLVAAAPGQ